MRVGQVLVSKSGKTYLKFEKNVTISEGEALFISTPQEDINFLLTSGKITQEEADLKLSKVPGFVKYNIKQVQNNATL